MRVLAVGRAGRLAVRGERRRRVVVAVHNRHVGDGGSGVSERVWRLGLGPVVVVRLLHACGRVHQLRIPRHSVQREEGTRAEAPSACMAGVVRIAGKPGRSAAQASPEQRRRSG